MDAELQGLGIQLVDAAVRNTAASVTSRISSVRAKKKDQETIAELEDIINSLLGDKSEAVRIAQAYEQELVSQRISDKDVEFISKNLVPLFEKLLTMSNATSGAVGSPDIAQFINIIRSLLSVEAVTVLQLLGFNFRKAIGEPLTDRVSELIATRGRQTTTPRRGTSPQVRRH